MYSQTWKGRDSSRELVSVLISGINVALVNLVPIKSHLHVSAAASLHHWCNRSSRQVANIWRNIYIFGGFGHLVGLYFSDRESSLVLLSSDLQNSFKNKQNYCWIGKIALLIPIFQFAWKSMILLLSKHCWLEFKVSV